MSANINGKAWRVTHYGTAYFASNFLSNQVSILTINGSDTTRNDTICRFIEISFYNPPKIGTYYFSNSGDVLPVNGTQLTYDYQRGPQAIIKWSTGGHVDITSISDQEIKGDFTGTVVGDANDTTTTTITQGKFDVLNE